MGLRDLLRKLRKPNEDSDQIKPSDKNFVPPASLTEGLRPFPFATRRDAITDTYDVSKDSLGVGISGKVLTCWHRETKRKCALKILRDSEKARREVILHKRASDGCRNIVEVLDVYENMYASNRCLLIVMECMEGGELFNRIRNRNDRPYTEREAANLILMIARAVAHLHHMDIAHRDLKPENLLFTTNDDNAVLKLTDFGFAKEGNNEQRPLNTPCYTPYYVAPEILSNDKYDKACDIWSMGVIMYILLCGYPPFFSMHGGAISAGMKTKIRAGQYQFPSPEWDNVSDEAKSIIQNMLTVDPSARVTIDWILRCPWFTGSVPETPINIGPMMDLDNFEQMRIESERFSSFEGKRKFHFLVAAANHAQRRVDEEENGNIHLIAPERARVAQRAAARRQRQAPTETVPAALSQIEERE